MLKLQTTPTMGYLSHIRTTFFALILWLCAANISAQIFAPIGSESIALYTTWPDKGETSSLSVLDTVHVEDEIVFELLKTWHVNGEPVYESELIPAADCESDSWGSAGYCYPANIPLWLGSRISKIGMHEYDFYTATGDTLHFNFDLMPGDSSLIFADNAEALYMIYEETDTATYLNFTDSVAKYRLAHLNSLGAAVNSALHNAPIIIGKALGMIQFMRIDKFPAENQPIQLAGHVGTESGLYELKTDDIFDFQVGDLFQYKIVQSSYAPNTGYTTYRIRTVLAREETDTTILYTYEHIDVSFHSTFEIINGIPISSVDTTFSSEILTSLVNKFVMAELPLGELDPFQSYNFEQITFLDSTCGAEWEYSVKGSEWWMCMSDSIPCYVNSAHYAPGKPMPIFAPAVYRQGLGLASSLTGWSDGWVNSLSTSLIYYEKNGNACGNQWVLNTNNQVSRGRLKLWPNPAQNTIRVALPEPDERVGNVEIFDLNGRMVLSTAHMQDRNSTIDIQGLTPGVYLVKASSGKNVYSQKLVVH